MYYESGALGLARASKRLPGSPVLGRTRVEIFPNQLLFCGIFSIHCLKVHPFEPLQNTWPQAGTNLYLILSVVQDP